MTKKPNDGLLGQLKGQSVDTLAKRIQAVEQLEPDEHERRKRAADFGVEHHWRAKVRPYLNWLILAVIVILVAVFILSFVGLLLSYLWDIKDNSDAKLSLLGNVIQVFLVSGATLYIDSRLSKH